MFEVYSKPNCKYCVQAKTLLETRNEDFVVIDVTQGSIEDQTLAREKLIDRVVQTSGQTPRTMPQIFMNDRYIGGFDDLAALLSEQAKSEESE